MEKLFDCLFELVASDGGDGFGIVVCRKSTPSEVADKFDEWQKSNAHDWERNDHSETDIAFYNPNSEEGICFMGIPRPNEDGQVQRFLMDLSTDYKMGSYIFIV